MTDGEHDARDEPVPGNRPVGVTDSPGAGDDEVPVGPGVARQSELDLGVVPTGDVRVDAALAALEGLPGLPVDEHPAVYEAAHRELQAALADVPDANS